jgi:hypothetical protein
MTENPSKSVIAGTISTAKAPGPVSAAALWQQRRRWHQEHKLVSISIDLAPDAIDNLIRLGWLGAAERGDKDALAAAVIGSAGRAISQGVRP